MSTWKARFRTGAALAGLALLTACAPKFYTIKTPEPTGLKFAAAPAASATPISVVDERTNKTFSSGRLPGDLVYSDAPLDPPQFLAANLARELKSRGLAQEAVVGDKGTPKVHLKVFEMQNWRATGFSPFYTYTYLGADLEGPKGTQRIGIFVTGDKVPVWSFDEVIEPIFNQPMALVAQEFASKAANQWYDYRASDEAVKALIAKIDTAGSTTRYPDTYALGFTNNPLAAAKLTELAKDSDPYVRIAALSGLGTLHADASLPLLIKTYEDASRDWNEKAMAAKAMGDLGTPEAKAYLQKALKDLGAPGDRDNDRLAKIIRLFLD